MANNQDNIEPPANAVRSGDVLCDGREKLNKSPGFECQECGYWTPENLRYLTAEYGDICRGCGSCA